MGVPSTPFWSARRPSARLGRWRRKLVGSTSNSAAADPLPSPRSPWHCTQLAAYTRAPEVGQVIGQSRILEVDAEPPNHLRQGSQIFERPVAPGRHRGAPHAVPEDIGQTLVGVLVLDEIGRPIVHGAPSTLWSAPGCVVP